MNEEVATFFEYGKVELLDRDFRSREAQLYICMPCCLFLAVTPSFLGSGFVDNFRLREPIAVWVPSLTNDRFVPNVMNHVPLIAEKSNAALKQTTNKVVQNYIDLSQFMLYPGDIISTLPLGVYIEFSYRCKIDSLASILLGIEQTPHHGVSELRYAIARVLNTAIMDIERWENNRKSISG